MNVYEFELIIEGNVDEKIDALFEAGCDDATFGSINGVEHAHFHRAASTFDMAVSSAIHDVESTGLRARLAGLETLAEA